MKLVKQKRSCQFAVGHNIGVGGCPARLAATARLHDPASDDGDCSARLEGVVGADYGSFEKGAEEGQVALE
jgi:hypothetical protein